MSGTAKSKAQRRRKFRLQGGRCFWCKRPMILEPPHVNGQKMDPRTCTLDHLRDRYDPDRGKPTREMCLVAACLECNNRRGAMSQAQVPIEELRRRARSDRFGLRGWPIPLGRRA